MNKKRRIISKDELLDHYFLQVILENGANLAHFENNKRLSSQT